MEEDKGPVTTLIGEGHGILKVATSDSADPLQAGSNESPTGVGKLFFPISDGELVKVVNAGEDRLNTLQEELEMIFGDTPTPQQGGAATTFPPWP